MNVAVVGGGVIGLAVAHYLRRAGADVAVIDRGSLGGECSAGNAGWICPSISLPLPAPGLTATSLRWLLQSDSPLHVKPTALPRLLPFLARFRRYCDEESFERGTRALVALARDTHPLFDQLGEEGVEFEQGREGLLMLFEGEATLEEERALLARTGYAESLRELTGEELAELEPALAPGLAGGLLALPDRHVRPESLCTGLAASLVSRGVEVLESTVVEDLRSEGRQVVAVDTDGGPVEADAVVLAAGAETGAIAARVGARLPLQAGKGYSITVSSPAVTVERPLYFVETKLAVTPFAGAVRIAGTMELAGINLELNPSRVAALERVAERSVPGILDGERGAPWVGMRPLTPDGLPLLGKIASRDNLWIATGHQMLGMTLAPATGRALARWITDGEAPDDLAPFDPSRFQ